ncbi:MAG: hypothetical protein HQL29_03200 [Candidatus Omnitrophica bacterium]|nr:hypothetical protein [Candidatus Omnitrophota bacterium]
MFNINKSLSILTITLFLFFGLLEAFSNVIELADDSAMNLQVPSSLNSVETLVMADAKYTLANVPEISKCILTFSPPAWENGIQPIMDFSKKYLEKFRVNGIMNRRWVIPYTLLEKKDVILAEFEIVVYPDGNIYVDKAGERSTRVDDDKYMPDKVPWIRDIKAVTGGTASEDEILIGDEIDPEWNHHNILRSAVYKGRKYIAKYPNISILPKGELDIPEAKHLWNAESRGVSGVLYPEIYIVTTEGRQMMLFEDLRGDGADLYALADKEFSPHEAVRINMDVARAVENLRLAGIRHWDIKPGNVWLRDSGEVLLFDFDISFSSREEFLKRNLYLYCSGWCVSQNRFDAKESSKKAEELLFDKEETYPLGIILARMLLGLGRVVDTSENMVSMREYSNNLLSFADSRYEIPDELKNILHKAISDGASKYANAGEFIKDMEALYHNEEIFREVKGKNESFGQTVPIRDITSGEEAMVSIAESVASELMRKKKIVLAFHKELNCKELADIKQRLNSLKTFIDDSGLEEIFNGLIIIPEFSSETELSTRLTEFGVDPAEIANNSVFVFGGSDSVNIEKLDPAVKTVFIKQDKSFNRILHHYPIFEIVALSLIKDRRDCTAEELTAIIKSLGLDMKKINIDMDSLADYESIGKTKCFLVINLIPNVERFDTESKRDSYARTTFASAA